MADAVAKNIAGLPVQWNGRVYSETADIPAQASNTTWATLRSGKLHMTRADTAILNIGVTWTNAYIAESTQDTLYYQSSTGSTIRTDLLTAASGSLNIAMSGTGHQMLNIPAAGYRAFSVVIPNAYKSMFEPTKVHQCMSIAAAYEVYFSVPASTAFTLGGKYYGSGNVTAITIVNVADELDTATLNLNAGYTEYADYDTSAISSTGSTRIFKMTFTGSGRVAFWVDGIPNLFAKTQADLFSVSYGAGTSTITVGATAGVVPVIGATLPYETLTSQAQAVAVDLDMTGTSRYHKQTHLTNNPSHDVSFLALAETTLGLSAYQSSVRDDPTIIASTSSVVSFYETYMNARHDSGYLQTTYMAFADEPNLNYTTLSTFNDEFATIATAIKNNANPDVASTLIGFPQSSKFINGPNTSSPDTRRGYDQAAWGLQNHYTKFDAITWHEWMVRDLISTPWYYDSINAAYTLGQTYKPQGGTDKKLIISQTNMMSGDSTSTYEQDTFYASLWWASVVAQSTRTGKLNALIWFLLYGDTNHGKGMATANDAGCVDKIVAQSQKFLAAHMGTTALTTTSNHPEVDMAGTLTAGGLLKVFGVNKGPRAQTVTINLPSTVAAMNRYNLTSGGLSNSSINVNNSTLTISVAAETIFALEEAVSAGQRTITGSGFGSGPTVSLYDPMVGTHGNALTTASTGVGTYYAATNLHGSGMASTPRFWLENGRTWMTCRDMNNLSSTSKLGAGLSYLHGSNFSQFRIAWRWRVANGYYFPGSTTANARTGLSGSLWKSMWVSNPDAEGGNNDWVGVNDVVIATCIGSGVQNHGNAISPYSTSSTTVDNRLDFSGSNSRAGVNQDNIFSWYQSGDESSAGARDATIETIQFGNSWTRNVKNDCDPFNPKSAAIPINGYKSILINGWMDNGTQTFANVLPLMADVYLATGANARACIITSNATTLAASDPNLTHIAVPDSWSSTTITYTPESWMGAYNHLILADGTLLENVGFA